MIFSSVSCSKFFQLYFFTAYHKVNFPIFSMKHILALPTITIFTSTWQNSREMYMHTLLLISKRNKILNTKYFLYDFKSLMVWTLIFTKEHITHADASFIAHGQNMHSNCNRGSLPKRTMQTNFYDQYLVLLALVHATHAISVVYIYLIHSSRSVS